MVVKQYFTPEEIDAGGMLAGHVPVKRAQRPGYVSVKYGGYFETYSGLYGEGFIHNLPSKKRGSHEIIYYIKEAKK